MTLDGDGQHDPDDIPRLLKAAVEDPGAFVIGGRLGRLADARVKVMPAARLAALRVAGFFIDWLAGVPVQDTQSGFRIYPRALLAAVTPRHGGFVLRERDAAARRRAGLPDRRDPHRADPLRGPAQPVPPADATASRSGPSSPAASCTRWAREVGAGALYLIGIFSPARLRARHREMYAFAAPQRGNPPGWALAVGTFVALSGRSGPSRTAGTLRTPAACAWPPWPPPRPRSCSRSG